MRKFTNWTYEVTTAYGGIATYDVTASCGTDWYELMVELDGRPERWVVGIDKNGFISWFSDGTVNGTYAPPEGGLVIVTDEFDPEWQRVKLWNGESFENIPEPPKRTPEEIQADLEALMVELRGLRGR